MVTADNSSMNLTLLAFSLAILASGCLILRGLELLDTKRYTPRHGTSTPMARAVQVRPQRHGTRRAGKVDVLLIEKTGRNQ